MALLVCPSCKGKVSDQAEKCPRCDYPIVYIKNSQKKLDGDFVKKIVLWAVAAALVLIAIAVIINAITPEKKHRSRSSSSYYDTSYSKNDLSEYDAKKKITDDEMKKILLSETKLNEVYTPDVASIEMTKEDSSYFHFTIKGKVSGYKGAYNDDFSSGTFDMNVKVDKSSGIVYKDGYYPVTYRDKY